MLHFRFAFTLFGFLSVFFFGFLPVVFSARKALKEVEKGKKGWKEVLQKAPSWQEDGWVCLKVSPECRRRAAERAQKKEVEGLKETTDALTEFGLLQKSLHRRPPMPFQPQGALSHDASKFLGELNFPMGKQAKQFREECTDIAAQVINADEVEDVGFCSGRIWVHRPIIDSQDRWQECCKSSKGLKCTDRFVIPADSCKDCQGVCLDKGGKKGYCLRMGEPGSWKGSGGKVVELMSAQAVPVLAAEPLRRRRRSWSFL
ncbi:unnamed protein product [Effrenium voratum]|nr:unnamed protein product [Effrenium voratum]